MSEFSEGKLQGVPGVSWSSHIKLTHQNHSMHHNTHTGRDAFTLKYCIPQNKMLEKVFSELHLFVFFFSVFFFPRFVFFVS